METITGEEFKKKLESLESNSFENYIVICSSILQLDFSEIIWKVYLENIIFSGQSIIFKYDNPKYQNQEISFKNCTFHNKIIFQKCKLYSVRFENTMIKSDFKILNSEIKDLSMASLYADNLEFSIKETKFEQFLMFDCNFTSSLIDIYSITTETLFGIYNCTLYQVKIYYSVFSQNFDYSNNQTLENGKETFFNCRFTNASFSSTTFSNMVSISNSVFEDKTSFATIENREAKFTISNSTINHECYFDRADIKNLHITNTKFNKDVSFQGAKFDTIRLKKLIFTDIVFFDEVEIRKVFECDRNTLRTIKQQLQKAENKIDYNRFRSYELTAYYNELNWN